VSEVESDQSGPFAGMWRRVNASKAAATTIVVKIEQSEQLDLSLRGSNCTLHPFSQSREE